MLILLPPSERKAAARRGRPVDLDTLSFPELTAARRRVGEAMVQTSAGPDAARQLTVSSGLLDEVRENVRLWQAPARPAAEVYTGVLYAALDWAGLDTSARRRARARLLITSALWGGRSDCTTGSRRTGCRSARTSGSGAWNRCGAPSWIRVLSAVAGTGPIVDCRSSSYVATWRPQGAVAENWVKVKVFKEVAGRRVAVSHLAKHTRGLVAAALLSAGRDARSPGALPQLLSGFTTELIAPDRAGRPWSLVVLTD